VTVRGTMHSEGNENAVSSLTVAFASVGGLERIASAMRVIGALGGQLRGRQLCMIVNETDKFSHAPSLVVRSSSYPFHRAPYNFISSCKLATILLPAS
jgi:hypothetical protein